MQFLPIVVIKYSRHKYTAKERMYTIGVGNCLLEGAACESTNISVVFTEVLICRLVPCLCLPDQQRVDLGDAAVVVSCFKKIMNASKPSEHPPDRRRNCQNV